MTGYGFFVSNLAQTDALAKLLIEKGIITQQEFLQKISEERPTYRRCSSRHHTNVDDPNSKFFVDATNRLK